jgi:hypothetical protein
MLLIVFSPCGAQSTIPSVGAANLLAQPFLSRETMEEAEGLILTVLPEEIVGEEGLMLALLPPELIGDAEDQGQALQR